MPRQNSLVTQFVHCCICDSLCNRIKSLVPSRCREKEEAHVICSLCWWGVFAPEDNCHECPHCLSKTNIVIDLTKED